MDNNDGCYIIAEAGINHNGDVDIAKDLVSASVNSGADAVKFQTYITDRLVSRSSDRVDRQEEVLNDQYEMLKVHELSRYEFETISRWCDQQGIEFISTPYDRRSVDILESLDVGKIKIASADIVNKPLLERVAMTDSEVLLSTGMATIEEIIQAIGWLRDEGIGDITLLHCVSEYPAKPDHLNLRFIKTLNSVFDVKVGFSDHTTGVVPAATAVALGAGVVEKHITLDSTMAGPDHAASLEPDEFAHMVSVIRDVETSLGDPVKTISDEERSNAYRMRQSLHASRDLAKDDKLDEETVAVLRPADGLEPRHLGAIRGSKVNHAIKAGEPITWSDIA